MELMWRTAIAITPFSVNASCCQHLDGWVSVGSQVLCTTSTLAVGVNLPARLVVLRGTRRWSSEAGEASGYKEYDRSTCLQMIGRAGRPQFDTHGTAVIMTQVAVSRQLSASLAPMGTTVQAGPAFRRSSAGSVMARNSCCCI